MVREIKKREKKKCHEEQRRKKERVSVVPTYLTEGIELLQNS